VPVALLLLGLLLLALATGCTATPHPRTAPDAVERAALAQAQQTAIRNGVPIAADGWTQLWTTNQAGGVIERCVERESGGFLAVRIAPPHGTSGLEIEYGIVGNFSIRDDPFTAPDRAAQLVQGCVAATPIDTRRLRLPRRDEAALYSYDLTVLRRCLIEHGQPVPAVPDRADYEAMLRASSPWSPYDRVRVTTRAAWYALSDACPALPASIAGDAAP